MMQLKTLATLLLLFFSTQTLANYVVCLDKDQVAQATEVLKYQDEIYYSQQATQLEEYERIHVDTFYFIQDAECNSIRVKGYYLSGNRKSSPFSKDIDLAYTWIKQDGIGVNLAFQLDIPLIYAPVDPFHWKSLKPLLKDANRSTRKEADRLIDSIKMCLTQSADFNIYDSKGSKVLIDSAAYDFNLENSELIIHQYYGNGQEKRYIINLKQCFEINLKALSGQKALYIHGANYKQFYSQNQLTSTLPFLYLRVDVTPQVNESIIRQFERLIFLVQH
ncbi:hypothetical protein, partial [Lishizhenia sp.]|uniref:hypothetical protein n=1 Tax=Lishizhenia sp. TaxID=2497594 RepID=UPI00299CEA29